MTDPLLTRDAEIEAAWRQHLGLACLHRRFCTPSLRRRLAEAQGWRCCYCGCRMTDQRGPAHEATFEHVVPRQAGGRSVLDNLAIACRACNSARGHSWRREHTEALAVNGAGLSAWMRDVLDPRWRMRDA